MEFSSLWYLCFWSVVSQVSLAVALFAAKEVSFPIPDFILAKVQDFILVPSCYSCILAFIIGPSMEPGLSYGSLSHKLKDYCEDIFRHILLTSLYYLMILYLSEYDQHDSIRVWLTLALILQFPLLRCSTYQRKMNRRDMDQFALIFFRALIEYPSHTISYCFFTCSLFSILYLKRFLNVSCQPFDVVWVAVSLGVTLSWAVMLLQWHIASFLSRMFYVIGRNKEIEFLLGSVCYLIAQYTVKDKTLPLLVMLSGATVSWLGNVAMIQPATDFGVLNFLIYAVMDCALDLYGLHKLTWIIGFCCTALLCVRWKLRSVSLQYPHRRESIITGLETIIWPLLTGEGEGADGRDKKEIVNEEQKNDEGKIDVRGRSNEEEDSKSIDTIILKVSSLGVILSKADRILQWLIASYLSRMFSFIERNKEIKFFVGSLCYLIAQYIIKDKTLPLLVMLSGATVLWLGNLAMIRPATDFGVFNFLIYAVMDCAIGLYGLHKFTWIVSFCCAVLLYVRWRLRSGSRRHPRPRETNMNSLEMKITVTRPLITRIVPIETIFERMRALILFLFFVKHSLSEFERYREENKVNEAQEIKRVHLGKLSVYTLQLVKERFENIAAPIEMKESERDILIGKLCREFYNQHVENEEQGERLFGKLRLKQYYQLVKDEVKIDVMGGSKDEEEDFVAMICRLLIKESGSLLWRSKILDSLEYMRMQLYKTRERGIEQEEEYDEEKGREKEDKLSERSDIIHIASCCLIILWLWEKKGIEVNPGSDEDNGASIVSACRSILDMICSSRMQEFE